MRETVGFVGLGIMGRPIAANLLAAGYELVVHSRSPEPQRALVAQGARGAEDPVRRPQPAASSSRTGSAFSP
jgi:3-hydroxyisobutyrate dehydrogenase-like beta-hydroxyacid dehydrogenase